MYYRKATNHYKFALLKNPYFDHTQRKLLKTTIRHIGIFVMHPQTYHYVITKFHAEGKSSIQNFIIFVTYKIYWIFRYQTLLSWHEL